MMKKTNERETGFFCQYVCFAKGSIWERGELGKGLSQVCPSSASASAAAAMESRKEEEEQKTLFRPAGEAEATQLHGESLSCEYEGKERLYVEEGLFFVDWRRGEQKMVADQPPTSSIFYPQCCCSFFHARKKWGFFLGWVEEGTKKGKGKVNDLSPGC